MTYFQTLSHIAFLVFASLLATTLYWVAPSELHGTEEVSEENWRAVELNDQRLAIQVPFHWRLTLSERAREGEAILSAQDVGEEGQIQPASLNLRFATREEGNEYPLPDPKAYADVLLATLRSNQSIENLQLVESKTVERSDLRGTLVEYTFNIQGVEVRSRSLNLIATNPPRRYILSYGTTESKWEDDIVILEKVINSIEVE